MEDDSNQIIYLPKDMTIGVEIESEGIDFATINKANFIFEDGWKSKVDGTLQQGVEIVSPILTGNPEQSSKSIKRVCGILNAMRTECI